MNESEMASDNNFEKHFKRVEQRMHHETGVKLSSKERELFALEFSLEAVKQISVFILKDLNYLENNSRQYFEGMIAAERITDAWRPFTKSALSPINVFKNSLMQLLKDLTTPSTVEQMLAMIPDGEYMFVKTSEDFEMIRDFLKRNVTEPI